MTYLFQPRMLEKDLTQEGADRTVVGLVSKGAHRGAGGRFL